MAQLKDLIVTGDARVVGDIYGDITGDAATVNGKTVGVNVPSDAVFTDTKNTAGSTDSSSKLFLVGATSQAANPQTYSQDTAYVGTDGHLYSNSKQVVNLSDTQALTNKTYNGYTLAAACEKAVTSSIAANNNLPTSNAVKTYVDALMSYGSNSNGTWMRIGNLQICWHSFATRQTGSSSTWGTTYWSTSNSWTYPQAFSAAPTVTVSALDNISGLFGASLNSAPTTTGVNVETYGSGNFTSTDLNVYCIAIGFWQ